MSDSLHGMRSAVVTLALFAALPALAAERIPYEPAARSCPGYGPGFVEVPGTQSCIRIGGRTRAEYGTATAHGAARTTSGMRASGQLSIDQRTMTAYGPVRTYVRLKAVSDTLPAPR